MSFTQPSLMLALALLVPVALAFLVRRNRRIVRVPSTLLYRLAGATTAQNRRFRRIKHLLALLACLGAVGALVLAAAGPHGDTRGETVVFVVDVSASMSAGGSGAPLARAKKHVARSIAGGGARDRYAIVAAGALPSRLAGPCSPGAELDVALDRLVAERGGADVDAAVELAASLVAGNPSARVVVLGDGGESPGAVAVREVPVSRRTFAPDVRDNLGIAAFATRPAPDARDDEREALIMVATSSDRARVARVTLHADGRELVERRLEVPARGEAEVRVRVLSSITRLSARVRPDDGGRDVLAADDEATLDGAARKAPRVVLVARTGDEGAAAAFFVEKALGSAGVKDIVRAAPDLGGVEPAAGDIAVVLGDGPARRIDAPALYLATRGGSLPYADVKTIGGEATRLRSLEQRDALLRGVSLDGVTIEQAAAATGPAGARSLVDLDGGTVLLAGGAGRGAWVYLGIDPAKSDLVLRVAFPVLVANALHALGGAADVIVADTVARSEVTLRPASSEILGTSEEPEPRLRLPLRPVLLLALLGAALLALEAWAWRKGWAS